MPLPANKISREVFKKMIAGPGRRYLPKKISDGLKADGMSKFLYTKRVSKAQALKVVRHLQEKGLVPPHKSPSAMYRQAGLRQVELDKQSHEIESKKHIQANIRIDVGKELSAEDRGESLPPYDSRSVLGKRVIDSIDREHANREEKIKDEQGKRNKLTRDNTVRPQKPGLPLSDNLPDIDIG